MRYDNNCEAVTNTTSQLPQDPHAGNLLIRPAPLTSKSPYNFEVVLLDHGQYFALDDTLRINYSKFWLSLVKPASPEIRAERQKYAELVGNIPPDLVSTICLVAGIQRKLIITRKYPIFEAAITGRAAMQGTWDEDFDNLPADGTFNRGKSMIDMMPQSQEEMDAIRNAVVSKEGLLVSVFTVLRRVPRRVLMVLKLNDLTR